MPRFGGSASTTGLSSESTMSDRPLAPGGRNDAELSGLHRPGDDQVSVAIVVQGEESGQQGNKSESDEVESSTNQNIQDSLQAGEPLQRERIENVQKPAQPKPDGQQENISVGGGAESTKSTRGKTK